MALMGGSAGGGGGITDLTGDVTATGPGSAAATLASVGTAGTYSRVTTDAKGRVTSGLPSAPVTLTDAATIATDVALSSTFDVTLGGNRTLGAPTNPTNGQRVVWRVRQDGTGSRTLAFNAVFRFGTTIPSITMTTTANKTDYIGAIYNSADTKWDIVAFAGGL